MADELPRAVLWDLDGTLIDSAELHWISWQEILHDEGRPLTREEFVRDFGKRNDSVLRGYFGDDLPDHEIDRIGGAKEQRYRDHVAAQGMPVLPGVRDWLERLRADGWRQAVASSSPVHNIGIVLEACGITPFFAAIAGYEDVAQGKPSPDVFLLAAKRLSVLPSRCIVVEDAPHGVEGAHRAGMRTIGVGPRHDRLGADRSVRSLDELPPDAFDLQLERARPATPGN